MAQYAILIYAKAHVEEAEVIPGAREAHDRHFEDMVESEPWSRHSRCSRPPTRRPRSAATW